MTYTDVWVGELARGDDPLDWGGSWNGNTPGESVTPLFPPAMRVYEPFMTVRDAVRNGTYKGKQVDWGAWAAIVTKDEITALIDHVYGREPAYCQLAHLCAQLASLRTTVEALSADRLYALVATEL